MTEAQSDDTCTLFTMEGKLISEVLSDADFAFYVNTRCACVLQDDIQRELREFPHQKPAFVLSDRLRDRLLWLMSIQDCSAGSCDQCRSDQGKLQLGINKLNTRMLLFMYMQRNPPSVPVTEKKAKNPRCVLS